MGSRTDRFELSLQTWALCHYPDHDYVLKVLRELGCRKVELGTCHFEFVPDGPFSSVIDRRVRYLNAHTADGFTLRYEGQRDFEAGSFLVPFIRETRLGSEGDRVELVFEYRRTDFSSLAAKYEEKGVEICTLGAYVLPAEPADRAKEARRLFDLARAIRAGFVEMHTIREPYIPILEALSEEYGIAVAVHNHGKTHEFGRSSQIRPLLDRTSFGLVLDTAWAVDAGEDPAGMVREFRDRLLGVHFKGVDVDGVGAPGFGSFDLTGLLGVLAETDYDGLFTLEYETYGRDALTPLKRLRAQLLDAAASAQLVPAD